MIFPSQPSLGFGIGRTERLAVHAAAPNTNPQRTMQIVWRFFRWLSSNLGGAIALTGHVLILRQDCPHCGKRTLCKISTLHGHARCLKCGRQVHEREGGVGGATDEGSLTDITQEGHSQKKDSRKEVSREEDGETLGSMAARSPWKSFGRNRKLGGTSSAVEKVPASCAGLIVGKIAPSPEESAIFPLLAGQAFRPKAPYSPTIVPDARWRCSPGVSAAERIPGRPGPIRGGSAPGSPHRGLPPLTPA